MVRTPVVVLGACFGGLELTTILSAALGDAIDIVLVDRSDAFVFGFSKLDVMFGRRPAAAVRHPYPDLAKPGVRFVQAAVRSIDPAARRVVTDAGTFEADLLVVALGADLDPGATPGLVEGGNELYSVAGAAALPEALPGLERGAASVWGGPRGGRERVLFRRRRAGAARSAPGLRARGGDRRGDGEDVQVPAGAQR